VNLSIAKALQKSPNANRGFSLVELLIVIALLAIVAGFAIPNMRQMIINSRIKTATNSIVEALHMARSEAIARNTAIQFCPSSEDGNACLSSAAYQFGARLSVADNNDLIYRTEGLPENISITSDVASTNNWTIKNFGIPSQPGYFFIAQAGSNNNRTICIGRLGQVSVIEGKDIASCP